MLRLGDRVYIINDKFEQNLPIGEYGYIIAYDRNADNAFDYVIRVPSVNKQFYVPASDIEHEEVLIRKEAERIQKEALIDYALATKNEDLFMRVMNGEDTINDSTNKEVIKQKDFIKQVNLKAWI
jgi:signal peptidase I